MTTQQTKSIPAFLNDTDFRDYNKQISFLIFGYIREIELKLSLSNGIPFDITQMVLKYFVFSNFKFDRPSKCFNISDNKKSITLLAGKYGTIQFGDFLKSTDKIIYRVSFFMQNIDASFIGIGFIEPLYDKWQHSMFNECEKYCTYIYGNTCYRASPEFKVINKPHTNINTFINAAYVFCGWWQTNDKVIVEMNMFTMKAKISCMTQQDDGSYTQHPFTFQLNLPDNIAIIIDGGVKEQTVKVHQQSFSYY